MGFFDAVKQKAGALAGDAERAGRVTAAQARLVVLQNDVRKAERELGHEVYALIERGQLAHPDIAAGTERLRATLAEVHEKEAEIAALRRTPDASQAPAETPVSAPPTTAGEAQATDGPAEPVSESPLSAAEESLATAAEPGVVSEEPTEAAGAQNGAEPSPPPAPVADAPKRKPAATKTAAKKTPATKKAPARKAPARKAPAKKPPAAGKAPARKKPAAEA